MNNTSYTVKGGIYLVVDPAMQAAELLAKTKDALEAGIDVVQVWNHWPEHTDKESLIRSLGKLAHSYQVPVIINEDLSLLQIDCIDGIHFDQVPEDINAIRKQAGRNIITGITCGNDFTKIEWAVANQVNYISFCSVFPSSSVDTCELVDREIIRRTRAFTALPIFLSGGITLDNLGDLKDTGLNGIAVISGIMSSQNSYASAKAYTNALKNIKQS